MMVTEELARVGEARRAAVRNGEYGALVGGSRLLTPGGSARTVSTSWLGAPTLRASKQTRDGKEWYVVEGYATVYERGYEMWDMFGPYTEVVSAGAAEATLKANPDVVFLVNHRGLSMARTTARTLELWSDDTGMGDRAFLNPGRSDVRDLVAGIDDGAITEQSFAFMITSGRWSPDYTEYRIDEFDIDRGDVSAVNYGANPHTSIEARAREVMEVLERFPAAMARTAMDRLARRLAPAPVPTVPVEERAPVDEPIVAGARRSVDDLGTWLSREQVYARD